MFLKLKDGYVLFWNMMHNVNQSFKRMIVNCGLKKLRHPVCVNEILCAGVFLL